MSYCGTCGGFYSPDCPRRVGGPENGVGGLCAPAPNPHEERAVNLFALAVAFNARVAGMVTANQNMMGRGMAPPFGKPEFDKIADDLAKEIGR